METSATPLDRVLQKEPQLANILPYIVDGVAKYRTAMERSADNVTPEFEIRLGSWAPTGGYVNGMNRGQADGIIATLLQAPWDRTTNYTEQHDYYYDVDQIGTVRQEVHLDAGTFTMRSKVVKKRRVWLADSADKSDMASKRATTCIRACVSTEQDVALSDLPKVVNPKCVRIKQRRTFIKHPWRFDCTMSWLGTTRTEAERAQRTQPPVFELELELLSDADYLAKKSNLYIAASALIKITDLFPGALFATHKIFE